MASLKKNGSGQNIGFCLNSTAAGAPVTSGGAGTVVIDGGTQNACAGTFTHKGTGQWNYAPTQAETNGTNISFAFTGTGAIQINMNFYTDNWDTTQPVLTSGSGTNQLTVSSGVASANATQINGVATSSVTTVSANVGTTQPLNFTGTAGSALVKSDMTDIAGSAVNAATAQIGVNIVNIKGTASAGTAGYVGLDWSAINAPTSTQGLTGTTISSSQVVASVTGAVGSVTGAVGSVTGNVGGNVTGSVGSVAGNVAGNVTGSVGSVLTGGLIDLTTTTYGEPSGPVAATSTLKDDIVWLKTLSRNLITQSATTETLYKDDGSTVISTSTDSDNGTLFTRGKWS